MAVVIDLLSSSPALSLAAELDDGLDFEVEQPAKKRRISPRVEQRLRQKATASSFEAIFELSSESSAFPSPERSAAPCESRNGISKFLDDDLEFPSFSSSAPELSELRKGKENRPVEVLSVNDDIVLNNDPIMSSSQPAFSTLTANLLAGLGRKPDQTKMRHVSSGSSRSVLKPFAENSKPAKFRRQKSSRVTDNIIGSSQPEPFSNADSKKAKKTVSCTASKTSTEVEREAQKERKRLEKEQRQQEKQKATDIAEVNKSKTNKKIATPELMIELSQSFKQTSVGNQVEEYMKKLDVHTSYFEQEVDLTDNNALIIGNVLRWQRKIMADYDEDQEMWTPLEKPKISTENHILIHLTAEDFCTLAVGSLSSSAADTSRLTANLDLHVAAIRKRYPQSIVVYLIEGLTPFLKKGQNAKNRAYTAAVRSQGLENTEEISITSSQQRTSKKRKANNSFKIDLSLVTSDTVEDLLLHLQLVHQPLLIHHTNSPHASASQISAFTQHLATRPYRLAQQSRNLSSSSFCMDTGQIRTSSDPSEVFLSMLQEINRVTPSMAHGIAAAGYGSVRKLVEGFRGEGNLMLEDVRKAMNKDGGWSDRRLGPMVSKRLYKVFMGRDPAQMDGIA